MLPSMGRGVPEVTRYGNKSGEARPLSRAACMHSDINRLAAMPHAAIASNSIGEATCNQTARFAIVGQSSISLNRSIEFNSWSFNARSYDDVPRCKHRSKPRYFLLQAFRI